MQDNTSSCDNELKPQAVWWTSRLRHLQSKDIINSCDNHMLLNAMKLMTLAQHSTYCIVLKHAAQQWLVILIRSDDWDKICLPGSRLQSLPESPSSLARRLFSALLSVCSVDMKWTMWPSPTDCRTKFSNCSRRAHCGCESPSLLSHSSSHASSASCCRIHLPF